MAEPCIIEARNASIILVGKRNGGSLLGRS